MPDNLFFGALSNLSLKKMGTTNKTDKRCFASWGVGLGAFCAPLLGWFVHSPLPNEFFHLCQKKEKKIGEKKRALGS
jgi:hypothetical protein